MNNKELLKIEFDKQLISTKKDPNKGTSIYEYQEAYELAQAEGSPITSANQLQIRAGGKYGRARIAYDILSNTSLIAGSLNPRDDVPDWFSAPLEKAFSLDISSLWNDVELDIQKMVESRVKAAEAEADRYKRQLETSDNLVECLQAENSELISVTTDLEDKSKQVHSLKEQLEKLSQEREQDAIERESVNARLDNLYEIERESACKQATIAQLERRITQLEEQVRLANEAYQNILVENGRLQGVLEGVISE